MPRYADLHAVAMSLFEGARYDDAEMVAGTAISEGAERSAWFLLRGMARRFTGNRNDAIADLTRAIDLGEFAPNDGFLFSERALLWEVRDPNKEADLSSAIDRGSDDADVRIQRALVRVVLRGDFAAAETDADVALSLPVKHLPRSQAYFLRGLTRHALQKYSDAEADLSKAERTKDFKSTTLIDKPFLYQMLADALLKQNKFRQAEKACSRAIEGGWYVPNLYGLRGVARASLNKLKLAERDFTYVLNEMPDSISALENRARARFFRGDFAGAEADLTRLLDSDSTNPIREIRAVARFNQQKPLEAESDLDYLIAHGESTPDLYLRRATLRKARGDFEGAEADLTAAIRQQSTPDTSLLLERAQFGPR
jgi:tetratricopeptide (TPR) repeat protein